METEPRSLTYEETLSWLEHACLDVLNGYARQNEPVPAPVQSALAEKLRDRLLCESPGFFVTPGQGAALRARLKQAYALIDDEVLCATKFANVRQKAYAFYLKHQALPEPVGTTETYQYRYENGTLVRFPPSGITLDFLKLKADSFEIEGMFLHELFLNGERPQILVSANDTVYPCESFDRKQPYCILGEPIANRCSFRVSIPLSDAPEKLTIRFYRKNEIGTEPMRNLPLNKFCPINDFLLYSYCCENGHVLRYSKGTLIVERPRHSHLGYELRLIRELWDSKDADARECARLRIRRILLKPFVKKPIWILSDRTNAAGDNGEALFRYLRKARVRDARVYFAISKDSPDYRRLKRIGRVVDAGSKRHQLLYSLSTFNISSHVDDHIILLFLKHEMLYRDIQHGVRFIFLQHGVTKDDVSDWLNRFKKNISAFVTSARPETESIRTGDYFYAADAVWETGMPRFDRLYHDEKRQITVMPTWRQSLVSYIDPETGVRHLKDGFCESAFFTFYNRLMNDERLLAAAKTFGYELCFLPHPLLQPHVSLFTKNPGVTFLPAGTPYREVFAKSDLVVTDYSSVAFDFAYLRKPVVYAQFDRDAFFSGEHTYTKGYFDYERDGFGEVETTLDGTVERIIESMQNGCRLKDCYRKRIDAFFAYDDQNNCRRVYEKIRAFAASSGDRR